MVELDDKVFKIYTQSLLHYKRASNVEDPSVRTSCINRVFALEHDGNGNLRERITTGDIDIPQQKYAHKLCGKVVLYYS